MVRPRPTLSQKATSAPEKIASGMLLPSVFLTKLKFQKSGK